MYNKTNICAFVFHYCTDINPVTQTRTFKMTIKCNQHLSKIEYYHLNEGGFVEGLSLSVVYLIKCQLSVCCK